MLKKFSVILFLTLFVLSMSVAAKDSAVNPQLSKTVEIRDAKLFVDYPDQMQMMGVKPYASQSIAQTFAPTRQLYSNTVSSTDGQANTALGRQIAYGGYYNAGCDYVYMIYMDQFIVGSSTLRQNKQAVFDWSGGVWDFTVGGLAAISDDRSGYVNADTDPKNGYSVTGYHFTNGTRTWSMGGVAGPCPSDMYNFAADSMPGPPNTGNIQTGYCGDQNAQTTPYIWPHIDVDTNSAGEVVIHAASNEFGCGNEPDAAIETSTLVYYRKVGANPWEGPIFMDSAYLISQLVVADKTTDDVYYCYLKPLGYYTGTQDPCHANGVGHYQLGSDVVYRKSIDGGSTWGPITYVTDYLSGFATQNTDPATYDLSAMVDPNGNLHLVWFSVNRGTPDNSDDTQCTLYYTGKLYHYDSGNDCISVAYDASHPTFYSGSLPTFHWTVAKPNVSWCNDKLYISFMRYGANPVGDTSFEIGAGIVGDTALYQVADLLVVGSDAASGSMGKTWTEAINLSQTPSDSCLVGECFHETYPSMARYSTDSLMIFYMEDKDPGIWYGRGEGHETDNPLMFMTWPCFTMADVGNNPSLSTVPADPTYNEVALAPNGNTSGCNTDASFSAQIQLNNSGNVGLNYTATPNDGWLSVDAGASGPIDAGVGPRFSDDPSWSGAPGCASPATIAWTASSATLAEGNYSGTITVDIDDPGVDDFDITVNLVFTCEYYVPECARITGGCWIVDLWNTPQAA
ncbi:MAG TPA: hypothetical protein ENO22_11225, partial [candidate division Zixibacteria bacterium]|nr:hypothetical protein [candidate division Zixibacteria bacterium]